jgi:hypothetical protein
MTGIARMHPFPRMHLFNDRRGISQKNRRHASKQRAMMVASYSAA